MNRKEPKINSIVSTESETLTIHIDMNGVIGKRITYQLNDKDPVTVETHMRWSTGGSDPEYSFSFTLAEKFAGNTEHSLQILKEEPIYRKDK